MSTPEAITRRIERPEVTALLYAAVERIEAAGVKPTPGQIVLLHDLAMRQVPGMGTGSAAYMAPSFWVGKVQFFPLTIQAEMWLEAYAGKWWPASEQLDLESVGWAMCKSGPGTPAGYFNQFTNRTKSWWAIKRWGASLPINRAALQWIVKKLMGERPTIEVDGLGVVVKQTPSSLDWGEYIARMCQLFPGLTPGKVMLMRESEYVDLIRNAPREAGSDDTNKQAFDEQCATTAFFEYELVIQHIIATGTKATTESAHV